MKSFKFNRIYVIQSLPKRFDSLGNEKIETGEELYNDLLRWKAYQHEHLEVYLKKINTHQEWKNLMKDIYEECLIEGTCPIIHLEIHGHKTQDVFTDSIVLSNGEAVSLAEIGNQLRQINIACRFNLFVTLAVCKGMSLLLNMHLEQPMPFIGAIGSFYEIKEKDLIIRYTDFYTTLFDTFDVIKSYQALVNANTGIKAEYKYIPADELFVRNYHRYLREKCIRQAMKERAIDSESLLRRKLVNRKERRSFQKTFWMVEKKFRDFYYRSAVKSFFMLDDMPENKERFEVPLTFEELRVRAEKLAFV